LSTRRTVWQALAGFPLFAGLWVSRAKAQARQSPTGGPGQMMLTIYLRHDESKTVDEINQHLKKTGWFNNFPPPGVEVVSWYVMMGIGQVVTLRFPAERLREINRLVEGEAWGGYRTEFYATYDYRELYEELSKKMG
jgi:hypothetical protein